MIFCLDTKMIIQSVVSSDELTAGFLRPLRDNGLAAVDVTAIYFTRSPHVIPTGPVRFLQHNVHRCDS